jgi:hypothetical protein
MIFAMLDFYDFPCASSWLSLLIIIHEQERAKTKTMTMTMSTARRNGKQMPMAVEVREAQFWANNRKITKSSHEKKIRKQRTHRFVQDEHDIFGRDFATAHSTGGANDNGRDESSEKRGGKAHLVVVVCLLNDDYRRQGSFTKVQSLQK